MKKITFLGIVMSILAACNVNNGGDNATNQVGSNPSDSAQYPNRSDTTSTSNNDAYNTTDTGASRGTTIDSSGEHSMEKNASNSGQSSNKPQ